MKGWGEKNKYFHANFLCFKGGKVMFEKDTERDHYMSAQEALEYGLIDGIMDKRV